MYTVYLDDEILHNPETGDRRVMNGKLTLGTATAGKLEFDISREHPLYGILSSSARRTCIRVDRAGSPIWYGRPIIFEEDLLGATMAVTCEGELSELVDAAAPPHYIEGTSGGYLSYLLGVYNAHAPEPVTIGSIPNGGTEKMNVEEDSPATVWDLLIKHWPNTTYRMVRRSGRRQLDIGWSGKTVSKQAVRFSSNLLSLSRTRDFTSFYTAQIATESDMGADQTDLQSITQTTSQNSPEHRMQRNVAWNLRRGEPWNPDGDVYDQDGYMYNPALVGEYGWSCRAVSTDSGKNDLTSDTVATRMAEEFHAAHSVPESMEVSAVDLSRAGTSVEAFELGQLVDVVSPWWEGQMEIEGMSIDLDDPSKDTITFGQLGMMSDGSSGTSGGTASHASTAAGTSRLPIATPTTLGGVKVGANLSVASDGTLSSDPAPLATTSRAGTVIIGAGLSVGSDGVLAVDYSSTQSKLAAGEGIAIDGNTISSDVPYTVYDEGNGTMEVEYDDAVLAVSARNIYASGAMSGAWIQAAGSGTVSASSGVITMVSLTNSISGGKGLSISGGGVKVETAGRYRISASVYIAPSSTAYAVGCYVKSGSTWASSSELLSRLQQDSNQSWGGMDCGPKIVSLSAGTIVYLAGRCIGGSGTLYSGNAATWLLIERVS